MASTYSIWEPTNKSIYDQDQTIKSGYLDVVNITKHDGLAFARTTAEQEECSKKTFKTTPELEQKGAEADLFYELRLLREAKENGKI